MLRTLKTLETYPSLDPVVIHDLRRALLQLDRLETRKKGQRKLEKIANMRHAVLSPFALEGLASSFYWSGEIQSAMYWCKQAILFYPISPSALWCSSLLVSMYKMLGMKKERFEAEGHRLQIMKKIAFHSPSVKDKIFALHELKLELEQRDRLGDAQKCQEELQDLTGS